LHHGPGGQHAGSANAPSSGGPVNNSSSSSAGIKVRNDLMPQSINNTPVAASATQIATNNPSGGHFGNGFTPSSGPGGGGVGPGQVPPHKKPPATAAVVANDIPPTGSPEGQGGHKTKAMLKGWSTLASSSSGGSNKAARQIKASDTFNAFKKAAQEKQERELQLQKQQESIRLKKEQEEKLRQQAESEKRREREEEEALEQARRAMMIGSSKDVNRPSLVNTSSTNHNSYNNSNTGSNTGSGGMTGSNNTGNSGGQTVGNSNSAAGSTTPSSITTSNQSNNDNNQIGGPGDNGSAASIENTEAERARVERERQRQREQERRRREAKANQIDMNMQSDLIGGL